MAAAQAQLQSLVAATSAEPLPESKLGRIFSDVPTPNGKRYLHFLGEGLKSTIRHQYNLYDTIVTATNPGAANHGAGAGNAVVQQEHANREIAGKHYIMSMVVTDSALFRKLSTAPFNLGSVTYTYLNGPNVVYLAPSAVEATTHISEVKARTWEMMPSDKKNRDLVLHYHNFVFNHNPNLHPTFVVPEADLISTFINGLHPQAKMEAIKLRNNNAYAQQSGCQFPAVVAAHEPNAGAAHPNAGQFSHELAKMHLHTEFITKLDANIFHLKAQPSINLASDESTAPVLDASCPPCDDTISASAPQADGLMQSTGFVYYSMADVMGSKFGNVSDFVYATFQRDARLRTCKGCGGINHFEFENGKRVCPTPQDSVPVALLKNVKYPVGVDPWRFSNPAGGAGGKGRGKGKGGKGKGYGGGRGGRGRGGSYWAGQEEYDEFQQGDGADSSINYNAPIHCDYDGWNNE
jgi:hypothetical protein